MVLWTYREHFHKKGKSKFEARPVPLCPATHGRTIVCRFKWIRWSHTGSSWAFCVHLTFVNRKIAIKDPEDRSTMKRRVCLFFKSHWKWTALNNNEATCSQPPLSYKEGKAKEQEIKPAAFCFVSCLSNPCRLSSMSGDEKAFIDPLLWSSACVQVFHFRQVKHLMVKSQAPVLVVRVGGGIVPLNRSFIITGWTPGQ